MNKIELLAPAGNMESLYAAVQCGADAVYLGGNKFSARANASNFDNENMINAIKYCHNYGVKVYVAINILIKENEMVEAVKYAEFLYNIGVDAIIVQDTGLAYILSQCLPELEIHASTQMTIHNGEGAKFLKDFGFKRIVLSRELSIDEIEYISKDMNIETEIFIHGALCICYSGQCLMSSLIGGRSGNRGRCAQPCRLPYSLINTLTEERKKGYLLSPKDICTIENIKEIIASGATSLKIEGRMKRPEYVAGVVSAYKMAIDHELYGQKIDIEKESKKLLQLFNREGFSKAYLFGNSGRDMMAYIFPKNTGLKLGTVQNDLKIELKDKLQVGNGIGIGEEGFRVSKILKDEKYIQQAVKGDRVLIFPSRFKPGDILYKTLDNELYKELENTYKNIYDKKILLQLKVYFALEEEIAISTIYDNQEFHCKGAVVQKAIKRPLDKERLCESFSKSMETVFKFDEIEFVKYEEGFLPISEINFIRRELTLQIEKYIESNDKKNVVSQIKNITEYTYKTSNQEKDIPSVLVSVCTKKQFLAAKDLGISDIAVDIFKRIESSLQLKDIEDNEVYIKVPNIIRDEFEDICNIIENNITHIKGIVTANLGIINRFKNRTNIIGDYKLNITNSAAASFYNEVITGTCVSVELNKKELKQFAENAYKNFQIMMYGRMELMVSEYCPIGCVFGGKGKKSTCSKECMKGTFVLEDRKHEQFIIKTDKYCRSYIYNSVPMNLIKYKEEIMKLGFKSFRLDLLDESYEDSIKIIKSFQQGKLLYEAENYTRGHYKRGVE